MSWQLASLLVVALALGAGFAWYERTRPSSRVIALVATLVAMAVLGRLAFAPLPNVKPATTDVILFAGFVLGAAPGFVTGAITALVSNFFISQGSWTPWQMVGWGAVGLLGAVLGRAAPRRELGRWPLAFACRSSTFDEFERLLHERPRVHPPRSKRHARSEDQSCLGRDRPREHPRPATGSGGRDADRRHQTGALGPVVVDDLDVVAVGI